MKVRIGFGMRGTAGLADGGARFGELVDALEAHGFDSIWCSERATGPIPDPMVALSFAAGRTPKLKLGTIGAGAARAQPGAARQAVGEPRPCCRAAAPLPAFGLGVVEPHGAAGVRRHPRGTRAPLFDEALPLMRRLWSEDIVDHDGPRFHYEGVSIGTRPIQQPLDVWLGGRAPAELRRVGRLGDGWLPSFCTPAMVAEGRVIVEKAAADAGRAIDPEHFGAMVFYARTEMPERATRSAIAKRARRRPRRGDHGRASTRSATASRSSSRSASRSSCPCRCSRSSRGTRSSTRSPTRSSTSSSSHAG